MAADQKVLRFKADIREKLGPTATPELIDDLAAAAMRLRTRAVELLRDFPGPIDWPALAMMLQEEKMILADTAVEVSDKQRVSLLATLCSKALLELEDLREALVAAKQSKS